MGKTIQMPTLDDMLSAKYKGIHGDLKEIEDFEKKETINRKDSNLEAHMNMYKTGKDLAKDIMDKSVAENEDAAKEAITGMLKQYVKDNHGATFKHLEDELKDMKAGDQYTFMIDIFNAHHTATNKEGKSIRSFNDIVDKYTGDSEATVKEMFNEIGDRISQYSDHATQHSVNADLRKKVMKFEEKHGDKIIDYVKQGAALQGFDYDLTGKIHLNLLQEGGKYNIASHIKSGLTEEIGKQIGLKKRLEKEKGEHKIIQMYDQKELPTYNSKAA